MEQYFERHKTSREELGEECPFFVVVIFGPTYTLGSARHFQVSYYRLQVETRWHPVSRR